MRDRWDRLRERWEALRPSLRVLLVVCIATIATGLIWISVADGRGVVEHYHQIELTIDGVDDEVRLPLLVEAALRGLNGLQDVATSARGRVTVRYDAKRLAPRQILERLARHDYQVRSRSPVVAVTRVGTREWRARLDAPEYPVNGHGRCLVSTSRGEGVGTVQFSAFAEDSIHLVTETGQLVGEESEFPFTVVSDNAGLSWIDLEVHADEGELQLRVPVDIVPAVSSN
ncbi:MAG: hypothetical protein KDC38_07850 [Planctomycetes bacterium]|nr:hypothetical protein [Planctomycetota bacterium]